MSLDNVVFLDTETTGLSPERHETWEVGLIEGNGNEHHWFLPLFDFKNADLIALNIGGFFHRYTWGRTTPDSPKSHIAWIEQDTPSKEVVMRNMLQHIEELTRGKHIVGAIPSFDTERLARLFYRFDLVPSWHYHLIDVEALSIGYLASQKPVIDVILNPPWKSDDIFRLLQVEPTPTEEKHTALGDARQCMRVYKKVMGLE